MVVYFVSISIFYQAQSNIITIFKVSQFLTSKFDRICDAKPFFLITSTLLNDACRSFELISVHAVLGFLEDSSYQKLVWYLDKISQLLIWVGKTKDLWSPISKFLRIFAFVWRYKLLFHAINIH